MCNFSCILTLNQKDAVHQILLSRYRENFLNLNIANYFYWLYVLLLCPVVVESFPHPSLEVDFSQLAISDAPIIDKTLEIGLSAAFSHQQSVKY